MEPGPGRVAAHVRPSARPSARLLRLFPHFSIPPFPLPHQPSGRPPGLIGGGGGQRARQVEAAAARLGAGFVPWTPAAGAAAERLAVAVISADLNGRPVGQLVQSVPGLMDRSRFEVLVFSLSQNDGSQVTGEYVASWNPCFICSLARTHARTLPPPLPPPHTHVRPRTSRLASSLALSPPLPAPWVYSAGQAAASMQAGP
jgi:hypothetical protein